LNGQFDQAPVRSDGELAGIVITAELEGVDSIVEVLRPLDEHMLESGDAAVGDVIRGLIPDRPLLFVVDGHQVTGFVTPSDLNKHPARFHFYLLLADLEMILASVVLQEFPRLREALFVLDLAEVKRITGRFDRDQAAKVEANLAAAMDLSHLLVVAYTSERIRSALGAPDFGEWLSVVDRLVGLRNAVMHPTLEFIGTGRSLQDLIDFENQIRDWLKGLGTIGTVRL
jgi:hypothetical protein